jgi:hypothetical protein
MDYYLKRGKRQKGRRPKSACLVYGLYDAQGELRYIGQTRSRLERRLIWHWRHIEQKLRMKLPLSPVERWLAESRLKGECGGLGANARVIDQNATWDVSEIIYIERARVAGAQLLNVLRGGVDTFDSFIRENRG